MAAMTSSNSNFQNPRKTYKVYILEIIRAKFHQNRFSRLGCSADTHRQTHAHTHAHTHTHTHTHTHIHTPSVRSQHIQSKWLNIKTTKTTTTTTIQTTAWNVKFLNLIFCTKSYPNLLSTLLYKCFTILINNKASCLRRLKIIVCFPGEM